MAEILGDPEELMAIIRRTAQQEALNLEAEAQRQIQRKHSEAEASAQLLRDEILAQAQSAAAELRRRQLAQAALENQRQLLQAREAMLEQVWSLAAERLHELVNQPDYVNVLQRLTRVAVERLGSGEIMLAADPVGQQLLTPERLAEWSAEMHCKLLRAASPAATWGGLIARHADGRQQIDASFATRLILARSELREQIAQRLELV